MVAVACRRARGNTWPDPALLGPLVVSLALAALLERLGVPAEAVLDAAGTGEPDQRAGELLDGLVVGAAARLLPESLVAGALDQAELGRKSLVDVGQRGPSYATLLVG